MDLILKKFIAITLARLNYYLGRFWIPSNISQLLLVQLLSIPILWTIATKLCEEHDNNIMFHYVITGTIVHQGPRVSRSTYLCQHMQMIQILSEEGVPWLGTVINLCFIKLC